MLILSCNRTRQVLPSMGLVQWTIEPDLVHQTANFSVFRGFIQPGGVSFKIYFVAADPSFNDYAIFYVCTPTDRGHVDAGFVLFRQNPPKQSSVTAALRILDSHPILRNMKRIENNEDCSSQFTLGVKIFNK